MVDNLFIVPFQQLLWSLFYAIALFVWGTDRAGLQAGALMNAAQGWLIDDVFGPGIGDFQLISKGLLPIFMLIALFLCGFGYVLAPYAKIRPVDPQKAFGWFLFALFFMNYGPAMYVDFETWRREIAGEFYQIVIDQASGSSSSLGIIGAIQTGPMDDEFGTLANQFAPWLPMDNQEDGLDIAMAFILATGQDVIVNQFGLPPDFSEAFFDPDKGPDHYMTMTPQDRIDSLMTALRGIMRMWFAWVLIILGLIEQAINLCLSISAGILFLSMCIAILFSFFQRTEIMAKAIMDMWLSLFIFTIFAAVIEAFGIGIALMGAASLKPTVALGTGIVAEVILSILLFRAIGTITESLDKLFIVASQVVGGKLMGPGELSSSVAGGLATAGVGIAAAVATGGLSLAGSAALGAAGAAVTKAAGGSTTQVLGSALSGSDALFNASAIASMVLPDDSTLKKPLTGFYEGALSNRMLGPAGGLMLRARNQERAEADEAEDSGSNNGSGSRRPTPRGGGSPTSGSNLLTGSGNGNGNGSGSRSDHTQPAMQPINPDRDQAVKFDTGDMAQISNAVAMGVTQGLQNASGSDFRLNHPSMADADIEGLLGSAINKTRSEMSQGAWQTEGYERRFERNLTELTKDLSPEQREAVEAYQTHPETKHRAHAALYEGVSKTPEFNDYGPMRYDVRIEKDAPVQLQFAEGLQPVTAAPASQRPQASAVGAVLPNANEPTVAPAPTSAPAPSAPPTDATSH